MSARDSEPTQEIKEETHKKTKRGGKSKWRKGFRDQRWREQQAQADQQSEEEGLAADTGVQTYSDVELLQFWAAGQLSVTPKTPTPPPTSPPGVLKPPTSPPDYVPQPQEGGSSGSAEAPQRTAHVEEHQSPHSVATEVPSPTTSEKPVATEVPSPTTSEEAPPSQKRKVTLESEPLEAHSVQVTLASKTKPKPKPERPEPPAKPPPPNPAERKPKQESQVVLHSEKQKGFPSPSEVSAHFEHHYKIPQKKRLFGTIDLHKVLDASDTAEDGTICDEYVFDLLALLDAGYVLCILSFIGKESKKLQEHAIESVEDLNKRLKRAADAKQSKLLPIPLQICNSRTHFKWGKVAWHNFLCKEAKAESSFHIDDAPDICAAFDEAWGVTGSPYCYRVDGRGRVRHPRDQPVFRNFPAVVKDILSDFPLQCP
jgi:hypothetical protein